MAKEHEFKFIKGEMRAGYPADICFYTDVDYWSVNDFIYEFDWLVNFVSPSKIRIHINSVGGSVVDGMSVFTKIIDCPIPTECINDALAASMGSIIWAAGDEVYMKDYALLMIHNPFCDNNGKKEYDQATEAFTKQLKTIYIKRFGLNESDVEDIMNGKEGEDGTFLTAAQAVERGFICQSHIIETPQAIKNQIQTALNDSKNLAQLKAVYNLVTSDFPIKTINVQNNNSKLKTMEKNEVTVFAALFGLTGDKATSENVTAKIEELKAAANKAEENAKLLAKANEELAEVKAELTGTKTSVNNLTKDLEQTKAELKKYQEAEVKAFESKVFELIDGAIDECKIGKEERDVYIEMAKNNFELARNVLSKIPACNKLTKEISEENKEEAKEGLKSEEQKIQDEVSKVVGKEFKFRSL